MEEFLCKITQYIYNIYIYIFMGGGGVAVVFIYNLWVSSAECAQTKKNDWTGGGCQCSLWGDSPLEPHNGGLAVT